MFCPVCKDEFRPGFTRCAGCGVDLVERLDAAAPRVAAPSGARPVGALLAMQELCGFLSLDDAREQRDRLRAEGIRADILIREAPDASGEDEVAEEYWLRVEREGRVRAEAILEGAYEHDAGAEYEQGPAPFACDRCGQAVTEDDDRCPKCGARFDD